MICRPGALISETIWVSPATYLPVRAVVRFPFGKLAFRKTADISWLRPTAQDLGKLAVPVPAGFRHVPLGRLIRPLLAGGRYLPGCLGLYPAMSMVPASGKTGDGDRRYGTSQASRRNRMNDETGSMRRARWPRAGILAAIAAGIAVLTAA